MTLPVKLNKPALIEAVTEFKFIEKQNIEDLFFSVYAKLKPQGYKYVKLPIMELPLAIREGDIKFSFQPYYRMEKGKYIINIGPQVLSFGINGYYDGWEEYKKFILDNLKELADIFTNWNASQSSMRYINLFEDSDIFDSLNVKMELPSSVLTETIIINKKVFYNEFSYSNGIQIRMHIANDTEIAKEGSQITIKGTIVDIDSSIKSTIGSADEVISKLHDKVKILFFALLKKELLASLEPQE